MPKESIEQAAPTTTHPTDGALSRATNIIALAMAESGAVIAPLFLLVDAV